MGRKSYNFFLTRWLVGAAAIGLAFALCAVYAYSEDREPEAGGQENAGEAGYEEAVPEEVSPEDERITLDLKGVDILEIFRMLSLKTGLTIVPSKEITGRINVFLNNVTFKDALDVILLSQGFAVERKGKIIFIMTAEEYKNTHGEDYVENRKFRSFKLAYAKPASVFTALSELKSDIGKVIVDESSGTVMLIDVEEKLDLMADAIKKLDQPLVTEVFDLNYADPEDIEPQITAAITPGLGEASVDKRARKVIVTDLPSKIAKIRKIVKAVDEKSRQVYIEAEIMQITYKDEYQKGINWRRFFNADKDNLSFNLTLGTPASFTPSPLLSASNLRMSVGTFSRDNYDFVLQFLQTYGDTKILSRPRLAVVNNEEAKVMVGTREAYVTQTQSQAQTTTVTSESIEFVDVGVKLNVVPTIGKDGFITMKIKPEVSRVSEILNTTLGSRVPIVETSEAETVVKVKDGTMVMIAGLIKDEKRKDETNIPLLSRIPFIRHFFSSKATQWKRTELLVFLTPHLITGEETALGPKLKKSIPPDIMPEDIKQAIIEKELEGIKLKPQPPEKEGEPALNQSKPPAEEEVPLKLKGLKEY